MIHISEERGPLSVNLTEDQERWSGMQYDKEFKLQALELSDEIGVKAAAEQLGIKYYTLADWRSQRKARGEGAFVGSGNKVMPLSELDDYVVVAEYETTTQFREIEKLKAKEATVSGMEIVQVVNTHITK